MAHDDNPFNDPAPPRPPAKSSRSHATTDSYSKASSPSQAKRTQSHDSNGLASAKAAAADSKPRSSGKGRKKGSQHADVIDRLDFTGVGPMFHHDGPFDACAPSRNKHRNKAPMFAWSGPPGEAPPQEQFTPDNDPYPSPNAYGSYAEPPSRNKKVDAIAEAWGIHEPEPYEEFFAGGGARPDGTPASSIYNGKEKHQEKESRSSRPRNAARRSALPPPQPIFGSESFDANDPVLAQDVPGGAPKRSKSLMQRIRKMRDAPNVPVGGYDQALPSPTGEDSAGYRPTHRSQNSFLGRFSKDGTRAKDTSVSPSAEKPEPYVFIEPSSPYRKDLPTTPPNDSSTEGYFDGGNGGSISTTPGGGIGRKTSIMKKMGRVVRGTK